MAFSTPSSLPIPSELIPSRPLAQNQWKLQCSAVCRSGLQHLVRRCAVSLAKILELEREVDSCDHFLIFSRGKSRFYTCCMNSIVLTSHFLS
jgi:hypothetical protein